MNIKTVFVLALGLLFNLNLLVGCAHTSSRSAYIKAAEAEERARRAEAALLTVTRQEDPERTVQLIEAGAERMEVMEDMIAARDARIEELEAQTTQQPAATPPGTDLVGGRWVNNRTPSAGRVIPSDPGFAQPGGVPMGVHPSRAYCWDTNIGPSLTIFTYGGAQPSYSSNARRTMVRVGDQIVAMPLTPTGGGCTARPSTRNERTIIYVFKKAYQVAGGGWVYEPECRVERGGERAHSPNSTISVSCRGTSADRQRMEDWLAERWVTPQL